MNVVPCLLLALGIAAGARAATYEVGPGKLASPGEVPWEALAPGDTVLIHWQPAPYHAKWVVCRAGTAGQPITIRGVPGPDGALPVIDGENARTRPELKYWGETRGVIKIGGASNPPDTIPAHLVIENLEVRGGHPPLGFIGSNGAPQSYSDQAAALYVEKADDLVIRHCTLRDCAQGLFVSSNDTHASSRILVEGCLIEGNGVPNSLYQHNAYTAARDIVFRYNHFGPLRPGAPGNNLKDRSAGLVVAENWIEGGNRTLDLVDGQDSRLIREDPRYRETLVCGNVLIEPADAPGRQVVHYGGDSDKTDQYRKGTLLFFQNTVIFARPDKTTLLALSSNEETCDCRNNILLVQGAGRSLALLDGAGQLRLSHNWLKPGWRSSFGWLKGQIVDDGSNLTGDTPGFANLERSDYRLLRGSPCTHAGVALPGGAKIETTHQYRAPQTGEERADVPPSIGALAPLAAGAP